MKDRLAAAIVDHRRFVMAVVFLVTIVCAALIPQVEVNTDMSKYLADSSPMKVGTDLLAEQLPGIENPKTIRVMFDGLDEDDKGEVLSRLEAIDGVDEVEYDAASENYNRGDHTLYIISTSFGYASPEELAIESAALSLADDEALHTTAYLMNDNPARSDLPPIVVVIALLLLSLVLFVMSPSWIEPVLYLITIGCAVGINLGTNIVQGSIAQVTFSIGAILQLVLSMDYSIILMNRFRQELASPELMGDMTEAAAEQRRNAMKRALSGAFTAISASSLTTFAGLLTLVFMTFKIGGDLGVVLAKGVLVSLLCVFTVLPGLVLASHRLIARTAKPTPTIRLGGLATFEYRARYALTAAFVVVFAVAFMLQGNTAVSYTLEYEDPIADVFPATNQVVVLYSNADEDAAAKIASSFESDGRIRSLNAWSTTLGKPLTSDELADAFDQMVPEGESEAAVFDPSMIDQLYMLYAMIGPKDDDVAEADAESGAAGEGDADAGVASEDGGAAASSEADASGASRASDASEASGASGASPSDTKKSGGSSMFSTGLSFGSLLGGSPSSGTGDSGEPSEPTAISIEELVRFLNEDILTNPLYSRMIDSGQKAAIADLEQTVEDARAQMIGPDYSIMALTIGSASGSQETASVMDELADACDGQLQHDHYLIGDAAMVREMKQGFAGEMLTITLISAIAIFMVVAIAFRSLVIPAILVLVVQCGVYLTILAIGIQGYHIYYLAMLIVQCILMGATIDYGILVTNLYREARASLGVRDSIASAYDRAINTIMTSGIIMMLVTAAIALTSPEPTIGQICQTISMGATSAVALIMLFLPGILATLDRFVSGRR